MPDPLRILSFTTVFPRPGDEQLGLFVRRRLLRMAEQAEIRVVAPVARIEYGNAKRKFPDLRQIPLRRKDGPLTVYHPRWLYAPGLGGLTPFFLSAFLRRTFRSLHRRHPCDVIDVHFGHPEAFAAMRLAKLIQRPFTVTLRGSETMHGADATKGELMRRALLAAARVITVSADLRDYAISLDVPPERVIEIPNGIDGTIFHQQDRAAWRERLGFTPDRKHILSAGYLIERKGHHRVVETLPRLHEAGVPADLWIVGDPGREGNFADHIREAVRAYHLEPYVHFIPAVPPVELAGYMSACDVFCLASNREGWPNVVNEALACGAPVVAARVGAVPEMIPDERYGHVVPLDDVPAMAGALLQALRTGWDRDQIAQHGGSRSWDNVASEALAVLAEAARSRESLRGGAA